jgi:quinol monooxygenase YgiN
MYVFITSVKSKAGKEQEVLQASLEVAKAALAQAECVDYRIFRSTDDPAVTVNFERWSSQEARNTFNAGPDVEKFIAAVSDKFAESPQPISYYEIIE